MSWSNDFSNYKRQWLWVPAFAGTTHHSLLNLGLLQRLLQILDQIVAMLQPDREPHKTFADAEFGACFRGQALMGWWWRGWVTRLLASPRLFEIRTIFSVLSARNAAAFSPLISNATKVEPARICFFTKAACG